MTDRYIRQYGLPAVQESLRNSGAHTAAGSSTPETICAGYVLFEIAPERRAEIWGVGALALILAAGGVAAAVYGLDQAGVVNIPGLPPLPALPALPELLALPELAQGSSLPQLP